MNPDLQRIAGALAQIIVLDHLAQPHGLDPDNGVRLGIEGLVPAEDRRGDGEGFQARGASLECLRHDEPKKRRGACRGAEDRGFKNTVQGVFDAGRIV